MKIILLREKGHSRALKVTRRKAAIGAFVLLAVTSISGYTLIDSFSQGSVGASTVAEWRDRLAVQNQEVQSIRQRSDAESQAVGRQLAQMQARLLRMEALGARITEVADLDEGEFSFAEPAPQGGPVATSQSAPVWSELRVSLEQLAAGLKVRESELEILESMLLNRDYQAAKEVAGRPVTWGWMSSKYGQRIDPFTGKSAWHAGVDFAGKDGSDVITVASGVVTHAAKRYGYGLMVEITHGDGYVTRYGHHAEILVQAGDIVQKGQVIGQMGSSGRATGPHVHFEVLKNGKHVDPARYVARTR